MSGSDYTPPGAAGHPFFSGRCFHSNGVLARLERLLSVTIQRVDRPGELLALADFFPVQLRSWNLFR